MSTLIPLAICFGIVGVFLYFARKAGKDAAQNTANREALKDAQTVGKPVSPGELDGVRREFRRD